MRLLDATKSRAIPYLEQRTVVYMREFNAADNSKFDSVSDEQIKVLADKYKDVQQPVFDIEPADQVPGYEMTMVWRQGDPDYIYQSSMLRADILRRYNNALPVENYFDSLASFYGLSPTWEEWARVLVQRGYNDAWPHFKAQDKWQRNNQWLFKQLPVIYPSVYAGWQWREDNEETRDILEMSMEQTERSIDYYHGNIAREYFVEVIPGEPEGALAWQLKYLQQYGHPVCIWAAPDVELTDRQHGAIEALI